MASRAAFFRRFMESLKIRDGDTQNLIPFTFNEPQELVWAKYLAPKIDAREPIRLMILKARQEGISTLIQGCFAARFVWDNLVHQKVIAHEGDSTKTIWGMAERMLDYSPMAPWVEKAGYTMTLGGSYYSCATAGSPHATRSMNITCLHLSEVAFWPKPEAWLAAMQTVPMRGESWIMVESTANGKVESGKLFYDEWKRAVKGKSRFVPVFLPWYGMQKYSLSNYAYA